MQSENKVASSEPTVIKLTKPISGNGKIINNGHRKQTIRK